MIPCLLQLVLVGLLELPGVPIVVTERILLKVLRPNLCPCPGCALLLLVLVLAPIDRGPAMLPSADDSVALATHDLAS